MKIGVLHVILWTFGVFLVFGIALLSVVALVPRFEDDNVAAAAVQSAVFLAACSIFAARRPGRTWSETFALRRTSFWLVVCALALGIAAYLPAVGLAGLMERLWPMSDAERLAHDSWFKPRSFSHGVALFVFVAGIGVFAEELLFRGALYTGLRPEHSPASAGWITSVLFILVHGDPRFWPAMLAVAGLLALARAVSGSLWPPLFLHAGFNATALAMPFVRPGSSDPSLALILGSAALATVFTGSTLLIARRSLSADRARKVDLEPDPGLGETAP
jgi:membrane protease YdiL (CAAX protease family)